MNETEVVWSTQTCILLWVRSYKALALYLDGNVGMRVLSLRPCDPNGYQALLHHARA